MTLVGKLIAAFKLAGIVSVETQISKTDDPIMTFSDDQGHFVHLSVSELNQLCKSGK